MNDAYRLGANTYLTKPIAFDDLAKMVKLTHEYWAMSAKPKPKQRQTPQ